HAPALCPLSLHDALPISRKKREDGDGLTPHSRLFGLGSRFGLSEIWKGVTEAARGLERSPVPLAKLVDPAAATRGRAGCRCVPTAASRAATSSSLFRSDWVGERHR